MGFECKSLLRVESGRWKPLAQILASAMSNCKALDESTDHWRSKLQNAVGVVEACSFGCRQDVSGGYC